MMRRETNLAVTDRIKLKVQSSDRVQACFRYFDDYIRNEVLAVDVQFTPTEGTTWDLNGESAVINIVKA